MLIVERLARLNIQKNPWRNSPAQQFDGAGWTETGFSGQHHDGIGWLRLVRYQKPRRLAGQPSQDSDRKQPYQKSSKYHVL